MKKQIIILITGVLLMFGLFGCGKIRYNVDFDGYGFKSEKTSYAEGEEVTVIYDMIATDTDYSFYTDSDDVRLKQDYDNDHGYIFTFTMPAHDVKLSVRSRNSMEYDPDINEPDDEEPASPNECIKNENLVFDYYEATVATVGGDGYDEYCLYKYTDNKLILACYSKTEDEDEKMNFCIVDSSVLKDCMDLVKRNKMLKWKDGRGLNGKRYVVKFMNNGELTRVTSDDMPENGREAFYDIENVLSKAWSQNYSSLDTETWFCPNCGTKNNRKYCMECGVEKPE